MMIKNEYQANQLLAQRVVPQHTTVQRVVTSGWKVGKNFSTPVVRKQQPKKSFWKLLKSTL